MGEIVVKPGLLKGDANQYLDLVEAKGQGKQ